MRRPVLVTGATGRVGRLVIDALVADGVPVRAMVHRAESVTDMPDRVDVVIGDLTAPATVDEALRGTDSVFLVWTVSPETIPAVVDAFANNASRVVLLSAPHQTPHPFFQQPNPLATLFADLERQLAARASESTILRPGMFSSNAVAWWGAAIRAGDPVRWPYGAAETAPVDERDVAAVAARALLDETLAGADCVLTGPEALSQAEQVRIIGEVIGRPVAFEDLTPDEFRAETAGSWPPAAVDMLLAAWGATIDVPAYLTTTVAEVLGRPALTFRQWVHDNAAAFTGDAPHEDQ